MAAGADHLPPKPTLRPFIPRTQAPNRKKVKQKTAQPKVVAAPPANSATSSMPLTIMLGPGNQSQSYKVPAAFQNYPKVQQLFPVYVSSSRKNQDLGKISSKLAVGQKSERQDPGSSKTKAKKPTPRNQVKDKAKALQKKNNPGAAAQRGSTAAGKMHSIAWIFAFPFLLFAFE